jgi:hypothetical protein
MNEFYIVDGKTYEVSPAKKEQFLKDFPNAVLKKYQEAKISGAEMDAATPIGTASGMDFSLEDGFSESPKTDTGETDTWLEDTFGKNFLTDYVGDIYRGIKSGYKQSTSVDEAFDIMSKGSSASFDDIEKFIKATEYSQSAEVSDEMKEFQKIYEEEGGGAFGFLKGMLKTRFQVVPQVMASSMATMIGSAVNAGEVLAAGAAGAGAGASAGLAAGAISGPGAIVTTTGGALTGLVTGVSGAMESGLTFAELLQDELSKEGKEFTKENIKELLSNEEKYKNIRNRSIGRGATIGVIEGIGTALTGGAVKALKPATALGRVGRTAAAFGGEGLAGGLGEAAGRAVAGQEMDAAEIGLEAVGGMTGAPLAFIKSAAAKPQYRINGENVTREQVEEFINSDDGFNVARSKVEIKNDDALLALGREKVNKARAKEAAKDFITDEKDLETFTSLELEKAKLKTDSFIGKKRAKEIDAELESLYEKYKDSKEGVETQKAKIGIESLMREEAGVIKSLGGNINILETSEIEEQYPNADTKANAFVNPETGEIIINRNNASNRFYVTSASHEMLHNIIRSNFTIRTDENGKANQSDVNRVEKIINSLKQNLDSTVLDEIQNRIDSQYRFNENGTEKNLYEYADEYVTSLSDIMAEPDFQASFSTSTIEKIQNFFKELLATFGLTDVQFRDGKDVISFVKQYRSNINKGKLSKRAKAMLATEAKSNTIASTVSYSKSQEQLNNRVDSLVGDKDNNGNYQWKSKEEFQASEEFVNIYDKIINGDLIDPLIRRGIEGDVIYGKPIERFVEDVKDGLTGTLMRFDPTANNSLIGWINLQLGRRKGDVSNRYKKEYGEFGTTSIDIEAGEVGSLREIADVDENFDERIDVTDEELNTESGLIDPAEFVGENGVERARESILEALSSVDENKISSFKSVPNLLTNLFAEAAGVPVQKITDPKKNLSTGEAKSAQQYLLGISKNIARILPDGAVTGAAQESLIGTSTGVQKNILKFFYEKDTERRKEAQGLFEFKKRDNITQEEVLEFLGMNPDGTPEPGFSPRSPKGQNIKALLRQLDQLATNTAYRKLLQENGANANKIQDIASGKSIYQYSGGIKMEKTQLIEFARKIVEFDDKFSGIDPAHPNVIKFINSIKGSKVRNAVSKYIEDNDVDLVIQSLVKSGQRGYAYEAVVLQKLNKYAENLSKEKNVDFKVLQQKVQRDNNKADILVSVNGQEFYLEVKLDSNAQLGSIGFSDYVEDVSMNIERNHIESQIKQKISESKSLKQFISKYSDQVVNGKIRLTTKQLDAERDLLNNIRKELELDTNTNVLKDIYVDKKDAPYILFGDNGIFAIDENVNPLNLPILEGNIKIVTRLVPGSISNGQRTLYLRSFPLYNDTWMSNNKSKANFDNYEGAKQFLAKYSMPTEETLQQMQDRMAAILATADSRYTAGQVLDRATAKNLAATRRKRRDIVAPSADDFVGLLYRFLDKGKLGEEQYKFFEDNLIKPFAKAYQKLNIQRQKTSRRFKDLKKANPEIIKKLKKDAGFGGFTFEQALRIWLFNKAGFTPSGINEQTQEALVKIIKNNPDIQKYGEELSNILPIKEYWVEPDANNWQVDTLQSDVVTSIEKISRKQMLAEWIENKKSIFSDNNMNKIEATYGPDFRAALEDMLYRMENGTARPEGTNKQMNEFLNWIRGSVAVTMFFNTRSAILQQLSNVNFLNWGDNNPIKAAAAIANIDQYAKDWAFIFNSSYLKERRGGLKTDVNAADLADAIRKGGVKGLHARLLQLGFSLTQIGDSVAIATGGATLFRNRTNTYISQGMSLEAAEQKAFLDFQEISEETQQSARPDRLAKQQTDVIGRVFLAFQNTPMQYTRIIVKAAKDLAAGRGDKKTHITKIVHYMVLQNIIFSAMQQALFGMLFDDEEDPEEAERNDKKIERIINNSVDTIIRGTGMYGAILTTAKNIALKFAEQEAKQAEGKGRADHAYTLIEGLNLSPAIGIKARQMYGSIQNYRYNKDIIDDVGMSINNPALDIAGSASAFALNVPLDRAISKLRNLKAASDAETETWAKIALALGWNTWNVGIENKELQQVKADAKKERAEQRRQRQKKSPFKRKLF